MGKTLLFNRFLLTLMAGIFLPFCFANKKDNLTPNIPPSFLPDTGITLTPINKSDIDNVPLDDREATYTNNFYLVCALTIDSASGEQHLGLITFDEYSPVTAVEMSFSDGYAINLDDNLYAVISGILQISKQEDYSGAGNYLVLKSEQFCKYFYSDSDAFHLDYSNYYGTQFFYENEDNSVGTILYTTSNTQGGHYYLYYDYLNEQLINSSENYSEILFYELSYNTFVSQYSWEQKFLSVENESEVTSLISMWQGLTNRDKRYILESFYYSTIDYGSTPYYDTAGLEYQMSKLLDHFNLYLSICNEAGIEKPLACSDMSELTIDYDANTLSGFNGLDTIYVIATPTGQEGDEGTYVIDLPTNGTIRLDDPDYYLLGYSCEFYYTVDNRDFTLSNNPLNLTFKSFNKDIEETSFSFATSIVSNSGADVITVDQVFDTNFTIDTVPEGYEVALFDEQCYRANTIEVMDIDGEMYPSFDASKFSYSSDTTYFEKAYNLNWELEDLKEDSNYYLIYRLKETETTAPSPLCGYQSIATLDSNNAYIKQTKIDNYNEFTAIQNSERFVNVIGIDASKTSSFVSLFDEIYAFLNDSEAGDIASYIEERKLYDRYYYQANLLLLEDSWDKLNHTTHSSIIYDQIKEEYINKYSEGEFDYDEMDQYVDQALADMESQLDLYTYQENAAKEVSNYFNESIKDLFVSEISEDMWSLLSKCINDIYNCTSKEEIDTLVANFKSNLDELIANITGA